MPPMTISVVSRWDVVITSALRLGEVGGPGGEGQADEGHHPEGEHLLEQVRAAGLAPRPRPVEVVGRDGRQADGHRCWTCGPTSGARRRRRQQDLADDHGDDRHHAVADHFCALSRCGPRQHGAAVGVHHWDRIGGFGPRTNPECPDGPIRPCSGTRAWRAARQRQPVDRGRGPRDRGGGPGPGAAVGRAGHGQDVGHPGHGRRHGLAVRDGDRRHPRAVRLRRPAGRHATGEVQHRPAPVGAAPGRRRPGAAVPRRDLDRAAGGAGRPAAGGARAGGRRPRPARRRGRRGRRQPARAGGRRLGPVRPAGQPLLPPRLDGRARRRSPRAWPAGSRRAGRARSCPRTGRRASPTPGAWCRRSSPCGPGLACDAAHRRGPRRPGLAQPPHVGHGGPAVDRGRGRRRRRPRRRRRWSPARSATGPGIELLMWHMEMDLPDPEEVLADPGRLRGARARRPGLRRAVVGGGRGGGQPHRRAVAGGLEGAGQGGRARARRGRGGGPGPGPVPARRASPAPPEVKLFLPLLKDAGWL